MLTMLTLALPPQPNVTNVWLVNLAAADLVFCLSRVLSLLKKLYFAGWPFGLFLCKFNGFFKYANMFCSVFLLAAISLDRALCVWRPVFMRRHRTLRAARVVAALVWAAAVAFSAPYFAYRQVYLDKRNETKCSLEVKEASAGDNTAKLVLYSIRFVCGFLLPFMSSWRATSWPASASDAGASRGSPARCGSWPRWWRPSSSAGRPTTASCWPRW